MCLRQLKKYGAGHTHNTSKHKQKQEIQQKPRILKKDPENTQSNILKTDGNTKVRGPSLGAQLVPEIKKVRRPSLGAQLVPEIKKVRGPSLGAQPVPEIKKVRGPSLGAQLVPEIKKKGGHFWEHNLCMRKKK